jgi:hypothetical protein
MKWSPFFLAALTPFAFVNPGVFLGHAVVLMVTLGIFYGTLSLGRTPRQVAAPQEQSRSLTS